LPENLQLRQLRARFPNRSPSAFLRIIPFAGLLPAPYLAPLARSPLPLVGDLLDALRRSVRLHPRRVDSHRADASQTQALRQFQHLHEDIVNAAFVAAAKGVQRPEVRLRSTCQVTKRQIFPHTLFQPARAGQSQQIGIQPYLQHQRGVIQWSAFFTVGIQKRPQV